MQRKRIKRTFRLCPSFSVNKLSFLFFTETGLHDSGWCCNNPRKAAALPFAYKLPLPCYTPPLRPHWCSFQYRHRPFWGHYLGGTMCSFPVLLSKTVGRVEGGKVNISRRRTSIGCTTGELLKLGGQQTVIGLYRVFLWVWFWMCCCCCVIGYIFGPAWH